MRYLAISAQPLSATKDARCQEKHHGILFAGGLATIHQKFDTQLLEILFRIQAPSSHTKSVILHILSLNTLARSTERLLAPLVYLRELY